jgi:hypothetical protein
MRRLAALASVLALLGSAATAEGKRLVRYDVGGGIAGLSSTLVVDRDGSAHQTGNRGDDRRFTLARRQLRALKRDLKAARFGTLKRRYEPDVLVFDGIAEAVRYRGRTVSVSSGGHPPARLERVLRRLARLLR